MPNLLWLQGGACSGNTMSFLNAEEPSAVDLVTDFGINVLWHPSLGMELGDNLKKILKALVSGEMPLDISPCSKAIRRPAMTPCASAPPARR